uniref:TNFAIP3-interacting protein 3 n=1 Tax=Ictidomys tridecemlineatus TaxID=43179 RepID=UPI001A9CEBD5|nr:TNFAIP3-interacting protein 3 [Ictidomys tridecemlineatus]
MTLSHVTFPCPRGRCESVELDKKIQDLIERNASLDPKGVPPEATLSHRNACPPKTPRKTASVAHSAQGTAGMSTVDSSADQAESAQSSRRKNLTDPLEQKIRCLEKQRKELLQVNQQWDQQFRNMKELYERKVAELRTRLRAAEGALGELECQRRSQSAGGAPRGPRREEERETLNEELQELKKENKLLKEKNALAMKKKEHYECEIQRLNKVPSRSQGGGQSSLGGGHSPATDTDSIQYWSYPRQLPHGLRLGWVQGTPIAALWLSPPHPEEGSGAEGGRAPLQKPRRHLGGDGLNVPRAQKKDRHSTHVSVFQVQIYEEDFRRERSDRERLSREKEELQRAHQASRAQLARLSSQIKVCQMEKEKLEKQLKQMQFPACTCGLAVHLRDPGVPAGPGATQDQWEHPPGPPRCALDLLPPDGQHKDNGLFSEKKPPQ